MKTHFRECQLIGHPVVEGLWTADLKKRHLEIFLIISYNEEGRNKALGIRNKLEVSSSLLSAATIYLPDKVCGPCLKLVELLEAKVAEEGVGAVLSHHHTSLRLQLKTVFHDTNPGSK